jgi:hypothetical protein
MIVLFNKIKDLREAPKRKLETLKRDSRLQTFFGRRIPRSGAGCFKNPTKEADADMEFNDLLIFFLEMILISKTEFSQDENELLEKFFNNLDERLENFMSNRLIMRKQGK